MVLTRNRKEKYLPAQSSSWGHTHLKLRVRKSHFFMGARPPALNSISKHIQVPPYKDTSEEAKCVGWVDTTFGGAATSKGAVPNTPLSLAPPPPLNPSITGLSVSEQMRRGMGKFSVLSGQVVSAIEAGFFLVWKGVFFFFFPPSNVKT